MTQHRSQERPLSPHIGIWRWQLSMFQSVLHRATGIALTVGTLLLAWWLIAAAAGPDAFGDAQDFIGSWFGQLLLLGWTWSLFFHLLNGLRHLGWDLGIGFELRNADVTGWGAVAGSVVLTLIAWIAGYLLMAS